MKKIPVIFFKIILTLGLLTVVAGVLYNEFGKIKDSLAGTSLISYLKVERDRVKRKALATTLDHLLPSYVHLLKVSRKEEAPDPKKLQEYITYFQKVAEYLPQSADAYGTMGYCYHKIGNDPEALVTYAKAAALNPSYFPFRYNLAVLLFKNGSYPQAVEAAKQALSLKPANALLYQHRSKIFIDIFHEATNSKIPVDNDLKQDYQNCYRLLLVAKELSQTAPPPRPPEIPGLDLKLF